MKLSKEDQIYENCRRKKDVILFPLTKLLAGIGITPALLSYTSIIVMLVFIYVIPQSLMQALYLVIVYLVLDNLDGSLARHLHTASDRGKFTDILVDNVCFMLFLVGLVYANLLSGILGIIFSYVFLLLTTLLIFEKNLFQPTDWLIRPTAGAFVNSFKWGCVGVFAILVFTGHNYLAEFSSISIFILSLDTIWTYGVIKNMSKKKR